MESEQVKQTVAELLVRCLEAEGVQYIFGVPGEENEDLLFALEKSVIKFVPTRHEQGAAFMADVWGRLTGHAGVCLATLGPGATNLITGLADAFMDKSPVVAITGQGSSDRSHKEGHQYIDIVNMFRPITKWNTSIQNPEVVSEVVRKAFKVATMEKPGVTHIELPEDVAALPTSKRPLAPTTLRRSAPDHKAIEQAVELLQQAKRPLILAGNGAIRKLASKQLREFVDKTNIPVVSTFMGKGAISDRDQHSLFTVGVKGRDFPLCALEAADLVIAVGYDIAEYGPQAWNSNPKRPLIHIDFTPAEVDEYYQPAVEIIADISATLWELNQQCDSRKIEKFSDWYLPVNTAMRQDLAGYAVEQPAVTVPWVLSELRTIMADEDILISDVGAHKMWIGRNFPVYTPGTCLISNGFASMGIALPGGLAAKLALPERRVVTISGDGGFLMNSQELETAKRLGVPYTVIVLNDNDYGLITWKQMQNKGRAFGTALTNPDFKAYAESFGIKAFYPKSRAEVINALRTAVTMNEVTVVGIDIDPQVNIELSRKLDSNLCANFNLQ